MNNQKWNSVLNEWVNCLKLAKNNINSIDELRNGEFFSNLQKVISKSRSTQADNLTFIFDLLGTHYPNYAVENKTEIHLNDLPESDLKAVTSLLMHYTCIYDRKDVLTSPLCHSLSQSTQLIIRNFLQKITKDVTNDSMDNIIKICVDDAAAPSTNHHWLSVNGSTPSRHSPLQDLLKTPVSKFGRLHEKDRIITKLRSDLETERYDKAELQQDLLLQAEKNKKYEQQLGQKTTEIARLRGEVAALENRTPPHYQDMDSRELQRRLRSEIQSLEKYIKQIEDEQDGVRQERDAANEQLRKVQSQSKIWEEKFFETERNFESLREQSSKQEAEFLQLQEHCAEVSALLEEYRSKSSHDSSLYDTFVSVSDGKYLTETPCEDLACSVIEVQLRDAQKQNEELKAKVAQGEEVKERLEDAEERLKKSEDSNEMLSIEMNDLKTGKLLLVERFSEVEKNLNDAEQMVQKSTNQIRDLVEKLRENSDNVNKLNSENQELASKVTSLQSSNELLGQRLDETSDTLRAEKNRSQTLESELKNAKSTSEKLQFELAQFILHNQQLDSQVEALTTEKYTLLNNLTEVDANRRILGEHLFETQQHLEDCKYRYEGLQRKYGDLGEDFRTYRDQCQQEKSELNSMLKEGVERLTTANATIEELKSDINSLRNQISEVGNCLEAGLKRTKELEDEDVVRELELTELQKLFEQLKVEHSEAQKEEERLSELLEEQETSLEWLEQEKSNLLSQLNHYEESCDILAKNNEELGTLNRDLRDQLVLNMDQLKESREKNDKLSRVVNHLEKELSVSRSLSDDICEKWEKLRLENQSLQANVKCSQEACDRHLSELQTLSQQSAEEREKLKQALERLADVRSRLEEEQRGTESLKEDVQRRESEQAKLVEELKESKETSERERTVVESELEASEATCHRLVTAYQEEVEKVNCATEELQRSRNVNTELELAMKEAKDEREVLVAKLGELEARNEETKTKLEGEKTRLIEVQNEELKKQEELAETVNAIRKEKEALTVKLTELQERERSNGDLIKNLQEQVAEVVSENEKLEDCLAEMEDVTKRNGDLEKRISDVQKEKEELGTTVVKYSKKIDDLQLQNGNLHSQLAVLQTDYQQIKNGKETAERQLNEVSVLSESLKMESEDIRIQYQASKIDLNERVDALEKLVKAKDDIGLALKEANERKDEFRKDLEATRCKLEEGLREKVVAESENKMLTAKIEGLEKLLGDAERKSQAMMKEASEDVAKLTKEKDDLEVALTGAKDKVRKDLELSRGQLERSLEEKLAVEHENKMLISRNEELEKLVGDAETTSRDIVNESRDREAKLMKEKDELEVALKEAKDEVQGDLELTKGQLEQSLEGKLAVELENKMLISKNEELEKLLGDAETASRDIVNESRDHEAKLMKEKDELEGALKKANETKDELQKDLELVKEKLERIIKQKTMVENDQNLLISEKEELEERLIELEKRSEESKMEIMSENREAVAKLTKEKEDLEVALKEANATKNELERDLELIKEKLEEIVNQKVVVERENKMLISQKEELENHLADTEKTIEEVKAEKQKEAGDYSATLKEEKDHVEIALKEANVSKDELQRDLESNQEKLEKVVKENAAVESENTALSSKNEELQKRVAEIEEGIQKSKAEISNLLSTNVSYKNEIENITKQAEKAEQNLKDATHELLLLKDKLEQVSNENSILNKKVEVEEIISSENKERAKCLEETIQDYEITISGLKSVVDTNLERLESLKEEVEQWNCTEIETIKLVTDLLEKSNNKCVHSEDLKDFIHENFKQILNVKSEEEKRRQDLEIEIKELKEGIVAAQGLNSSVQSMIEKLQTLVTEKGEVGSVETLKSCFDNIHSKVRNLLQAKQELTEILQKTECEKLEMGKQFETLKTEKDDVVNARAETEKQLKAEREKVENLRKELETKLKPVKLEKENILGVSTRPNKSREEELKKENMMLKRKIVLTENAKNNLEKSLKELREEKKKTPSYADDDVLYKKLLQEYIQVKEENERALKERDGKIEELTRESETLKTNKVEIKVEENKKMVQDLQNIREAYGNLMSVNSKLELEMVTLRKIIEDRNCDVSNMTHIKEAYEKLLEENNKVQTEIDTVKYKRMRDKEEFVRLLKKDREDASHHETRKIQQVRTEYEGKLEKMKEKMLKLYRDEVNKKVKSVKDGQNETTHLMRTVANLKSELFEADQKIQLLEMEREIVKANRKLDEVRIVPMPSTSSITSLMSHDDRSSTLPRSSTAKDLGGLPDAMSSHHNLQMEDEEDLFNDKYLTDLKEGRCTLPTGRESTYRFSELAWRNSMVPPHLKSSYPAETQFVSPGRFKDDDIKTGNIEFEDSLCRLLPGEKPRKKDFGTTSYKRPGPPTPSKNGGRLSLQGNEIHPMREHCETKTPKKSTPSRIRALFTGRNSSTRDGSESQNNGTPSRGRRLNIFRRQR